jgi:hypothetical protein
MRIYDLSKPLYVVVNCGLKSKRSRDKKHMKQFPVIIKSKLEFYFVLYNITTNCTWILTSVFLLFWKSVWNHTEMAASAEMLDLCLVQRGLRHVAVKHNTKWSQAVVIPDIVLPAVNVGKSCKVERQPNHQTTSVFWS